MRQGVVLRTGANTDIGWLQSRRMGAVRLASFAWLALVPLTFVGEVLAQESFGRQSQEPPREDRYVYNKIPDILIRTHTGSENLASVWRDKPVLLTMIFARCGGVCSPFLRSLNSAIADAGGLGADYRVVVLSFDPRDGVADMERMAEELGVKSNGNWIFAVASSPEIARLAMATGFWFQWDGARQQYDHPSVVVAIDRGKLVRLLAGASVPSTSLRETVQELRGKFADSYALADKVAFRCFEYDPNSGRYTFDWGLVLMLLPAAAALLATVWVFFLLPSSRRKGKSYLKEISTS
jgi:protein SCO1/2